ncbi:MAG TPA: hypothetical protein VHA78_06165 [Candidatus Peribacteraceae bacterium]|nr:hypothetical protein [Candidatus Peribacteraceae bacterium]
MRTFLTVLAGTFYIVGYVPYIGGILRGISKPSKASWLIWATLDVITVVEMSAKGVLNGQIIGVALGSWIVTILAFMHGSNEWKKLDIWCLAGAIAGIVLWKVIGDATIGIIISSIIMFIGCIPTFASAWNHPEHENRSAWTLYFVSCILQLCAIETWTTATAAQPVSFAISEAVMMILLWIKPKRATKTVHAKTTP